MTREDFIFTVGFDGDNAVVDKNAKVRYGRFTTSELLKEGFFKPALCSAIYSNSEAELNEVLEKYNSLTEKKIENTDQLKMVLGIHKIPQEITKIVSI